ncbi:MAG: ABC transporter permease, partial [bacterium]
FCSIAGFWGAKDILKISPADSMRRETPKAGHRIMLEKAKFIWAKVTFTWKIVIRNIFREKKKFIFISMGAAFTVAMMIMTFSMWMVFDDMFNIHYSEFMKMDYNVTFSEPVNSDVVNDLKKITGADAIEPNIDMSFELINGKEKKVVNVIGVDKNTEMYGFRDEYGNEVKLDNNGILLSSNLANSLHLDIGDKVLVNNFIPNRKNKYIEVTGIINQSLGINGYMDLDYMSKTLTGYNTINGTYINSNKNIIQDLENIKNISSVKSSQDMQDIFYEYLDLMIISIVYMLIFSGILGFVIIYSMSVMSINERKMEFSSLRVLGFGKNEIFGIILKENALMSIVGIIYGIPLGCLFVDYLGRIFTTDLYTFNIPVETTQVLLSILFTVICLTGAQLATYRKISKLDFIEALKSRTT